MPANNVEDAVLIATQFFDQMYKDKGLRDVLLEEVREADDDTWEITIGYSRVMEEGAPKFAITQSVKYERAYKVLYVGKKSGEVESMIVRII